MAVVCNDRGHFVVCCALIRGLSVIAQVKRQIGFVSTSGCIQRSLAVAVQVSRPVLVSCRRCRLEKKIIRGGYVRLVVHTRHRKIIIVE